MQQRLRARRTVITVLKISRKKSEALVDASPTFPTSESSSLLLLTSLEIFIYFVGINALVSSSIIGSHCDIV